MNTQTNKLHTSALHYPSSVTATGPAIGQPIPVQNSHVEEETNETRVLTEQLGNLLRILEERLQCVTNNAGPATGQSPEKCPEPYRASLAQKVRDTNNNLRILVVGLESLLPRIEL